MNDLIFNYLKNRKIIGDNLSHEVILNLVSLSKKYQLIGFICSIYKFSDRKEYEELNSIRNLSIAKNLMMTNDLKLICSHFNKKEINYCILKGPALNVAKIYDPAIRFFRDLDILVAKEDFELAFKTLNNLGYKYMNRFANNSCNFLGNHHHLPVMLNQNNTFVELHHRATSPRHFNECPITKKILKDKVLHNEISIPSPEALIGHTLYHGVIQHVDSIGPVILFDIKEIMKKYNLEQQTNNKYISMLELEDEFIRVNELLIDIENKDEINDLDQRINNIRQNLALTEKEGKIHIFNLKQIFKKLINNFFYEKILRTEFKYQTARSSLKFPFFYFNELLATIRNNIRLF